MVKDNAVAAGQEFWNKKVQNLTKKGMDRKTLTHCVITAALVAVSVCDTFAAERKVRFQSQGITCISMESEASAIPRRLPGVISSEATMVDNTVTVVFDDEKISATAIRDALTREGFPVNEEPKTLE